MAHPGDWKGLLNWSMKYQEDGTSDPTMGSVDAEKKKWLEKVMDESFIDTAKRMEELLSELQEIVNDDTKIERAAELWEEMMDHVENLDYALVFCQINGLPTLFQYLQAEADEERCLPALPVLSALAQNNPRVQEEILRLDPVPLLCQLILRPGSSDKLTTKALGALSSTIRGHVEAEDAFLQNHGQEILTPALAKEDFRVRQKALFLLQALIGADHATRERGESLVPLLPQVASSLLDDDLSIRHMASVAVSELSNLLGASTIMEGPAGEDLQKAMLLRREVISNLPGVDAEEVADEPKFWDILEARGRFLRDGETEKSVLVANSVVAGAGEEEKEGEEVQEEHHVAEPVLLIAPAQLSGASNAP